MSSCILYTNLSTLISLANVDSPTETLSNPALLSADPVQGGHVTQIINDHVTSHHGQELTTPNMEDVFDDIDGLDGSTMSSDMADFFIMQSCFECKHYILIQKYTMHLYPGIPSQLLVYNNMRKGPNTIHPFHQL